jgi:hypothetical protein
MRFPGIAYPGKEFGKVGSAFQIERVVPKDDDSMHMCHSNSHEPQDDDSMPMSRRCVIHVGTNISAKYPRRIL